MAVDAETPELQREEDVPEFDAAVLGLEYLYRVKPILIIVCY